MPPTEGLTDEERKVLDEAEQQNAELWGYPRQADLHAGMGGDGNVFDCLGWTIILVMLTVLVVLVVVELIAQIPGV